MKFLKTRTETKETENKHTKASTMKSMRLFLTFATNAETNLTLAVGRPETTFEDTRLRLMIVDPHASSGCAKTKRGERTSSGKGRNKHNKTAPTFIFEQLETKTQGTTRVATHTLLEYHSVDWMLHKMLLYF